MDINENSYDGLEDEIKGLRAEARSRLEKEYKFKKFRQRLVSILFTGSLLLCVITLINLDPFRKEMQPIILGVPLVIGVGFFILKYLQNGFGSINSGSKKSNSEIYLQLYNLRYEFLNFKKKAGILDDGRDLDSIVGNVIEETFTQAYIQDKIEKTFSDIAQKNAKLSSLISEFDKATYRINEELSRLRRSANLNLVIGTLSTAIAIISLTYEVFLNEVKYSDTVSLLSHYIPRISLVVFIEIFAFFFLKLYRANLQEIKYFNNEKTNIDFKLISLKTALYQEDQAMITLCLTELIKTERNFVLRKDESTVELEKMKAGQNSNQMLANLFEKLLLKK
ncbi:hypothetical protein GFS24_28200 [Chitinophaga sp. SYP-B3965]|uniref:hypothetical protein n=1 Tax=Chitinophaga sp. SYP-B3965 TaxID=2663120 RepID=UPI0012998818|nr:hypothetical protein [Chitinophaga sp. SYP-B3965]MRG49024.1 hypothetical protein [Chitinophaga sp. SYP-B3965]